MPKNHYMQVLAAFDREDFVCTKCSSARFNLVKNTREGVLQSVDIRCCGCGGRGAVSFNMEIEKKVEIMEFMDWPPKGEEG